jgi:glutamyl-tRNA synthetase
MLAQSGEKLAKRHAAVSVGEYRALGYPPAGVLNYLARFGWSHGDQEIFSRDDLIAKFDFANVGRGDGKFDPKKFADVAFEHLKRPELTGVQSYMAMVRPFLDEAGIIQPSDQQLQKAIPTVRERARTLRDAAVAMAFYFQPPVFDEKAKAKFLTAENAPRLADLAGVLRPIQTWTAESVEGAVTAWLTSKNLAIKDVAQPARVALTGRSASPGLFDVLAVLGKEESLARIDSAIRLIDTALPNAPG